MLECLRSYPLLHSLLNWGVDTATTILSRNALTIGQMLLVKLLLLRKKKLQVVQPQPLKNRPHSVVATTNRTDYPQNAGPGSRNSDNSFYKPKHLAMV